MGKKQTLISYGALSTMLTGSKDKIRQGGSKYRPYMELFEKWVQLGFEVLKARIDTFNRKQVSKVPFKFYEIYESDKSDYMDRLYELLSNEEREFISKKYKPQSNRKPVEFGTSNNTLKPKIDELNG